MSFLYQKTIRPVLFKNDAETIHQKTLHALGFASRHEFLCRALRAFYGAPLLPVKLFGLTFPNPIGLAAGMDKTAEAVPAWAALGFGFAELGAATWHAQPGNPTPRVFRAVSQDAIVNRMGFNNPGAEALAEKISHWRSLGRWPDHPVGMNLGKSKITPIEQAPVDYANSFRVLKPYLDFFVVNVSSPNTPNLRQLQDRPALDEIFAAIQELNRPPHPRPVLVKVAPDLSFSALDEILELVGPRQIAGIVATNTTLARPPSVDPEVQKVYAQAGGLSGRPLRQRSTEVVRHLHRQTRGALPIIGVGGVFNAADAWEKIAAGASLVQVYTGLVYEGPGIAKNIVSGLQRRITSAGLDSMQAAVGCEAR